MIITTISNNFYMTNCITFNTKYDIMIKIKEMEINDWLYQGYCTYDTDHRLDPLIKIFRYRLEYELESFRLVEMRYRSYDEWINKSDHETFVHFFYK